MAPKKYNCPVISRPNCACDTALDAKIRIGIYSGKISSDNSMPEFLIPTISDAPIAPIKLRLGVANNSVIINTEIPLLSRNKNNPKSGDSKIIGIPVSIQCEMIFDSINKGRE